MDAPGPPSPAPFPHKEGRGVWPALFPSLVLGEGKPTAGRKDGGRTETETVSGTRTIKRGSYAGRTNADAWIVAADRLLQAQPGRARADRRGVGRSDAGRAGCVGRRPAVRRAGRSRGPEPDRR